LWDIELIKEGGELLLRVTIDKEGGVDLNDCENVTHAINPILDQLDPIETAYSLEVTSAGLERTLRTNEHLRWALNKKIKVKLFTPIDNAKEHLGRLNEISDNEIVIDNKKISRQNIAKISLIDEFDK